jgi:hypothetical protein
MPDIRPLKDNAKAFELFMSATQLLGRMSQNGIRISREHFDAQKIILQDKMDAIEASVLDMDEGKWWKKKFGSEYGIGSNDQLDAVLYGYLGYKQEKKTARGRNAVDKTVLEKVNTPFSHALMHHKKLYKCKNTYISQVLREEVDGFIHPFYGLLIPRTFRCIAKGSMVMMPGGDKKIEDVKVGDLVYSYDDELKPCIKKVLRSQKTGHKKVVRMHWVGGQGHRGYLDLTPDHKVRTIDGAYCRADELLKIETSRTSNRQPKRRVLSARRHNDRISFTGKSEIEHRFISGQLGSDIDDMVVHHIDGNHYNNDPKNLRPMSHSEHSRHHCVFMRADIRKRNLEAVKRAWKEGRYVILKGDKNPNFLGLSRMDCLRELARVRGKLVKSEIDFDTLKFYLKRHGIDHRVISVRYGTDGRYFSKGKTFKLIKELGFTAAKKAMGYGHYRLLRLMDEYSITYDRRYVNQTGVLTDHAAYINNHTVTKIESRPRKMDVYDIEVEDTHCFIVNEVCVSNSNSSNPNFQNQPIRDDEQSEAIRSGFIPRHNGWLIGEFDFSGLEVRIGACYHKDPAWIKDTLEGDMHRDTAMECYKLPLEEMAKKIRYCGKNKFVFPECYGDYYKNCAKALWEAVDMMKLETASGKPLMKHLKEVGLGKYEKFERHIEKVEDSFWNVRYPVYDNWRNDHYAKRGYVDMFTGFRCSGLMSRNDVCNYVVQGAASHCLFKTAILMQEWMDKKRMRSLMIGQIHDSMIMDIHPDELIPITRRARRIVREILPELWPWITVPLDIEFEVARPNQPWVKKKDWDFDAEDWKKEKGK